jgi:hypothetical protein
VLFHRPCHLEIINEEFLDDIPVPAILQLCKQAVCQFIENFKRLVAPSAILVWFPAKKAEVAL